MLPAVSPAQRIPVIDFSALHSASSQDLVNCPQVKELYSALATFGFTFLANHVVHKTLVNSIHSEPLSKDKLMCIIYIINPVCVI